MDDTSPLLICLQIVETKTPVARLRVKAHLGLADVRADDEFTPTPWDRQCESAHHGRRAQRGPQPRAHRYSGRRGHRWYGSRGSRPSRGHVRR